MGEVSKRDNESPFDILKMIKKWDTGKEKNSTFIMDGSYFIFLQSCRNKHKMFQAQIGKISTGNHYVSNILFKTYQTQLLLLEIISKLLNIISFFQISRLQQPADHF